MEAFVSFRSSLCRLASSSCLFLSPTFLWQAEAWGLRVSQAPSSGRWKGTGPWWEARAFQSPSWRKMQDKRDRLGGSLFKVIPCGPASCWTNWFLKSKGDWRPSNPAIVCLQRESSAASGHTFLLSQKISLTLVLSFFFINKVVQKVHFSRGSSWPRDQTWVSPTADFFTIWATKEALSYTGLVKNLFRFSVRYYRKTQMNFFGQPHNI